MQRYHNLDLPLQIAMHGSGIDKGDKLVNLVKIVFGQTHGLLLHFIRISKQIGLYEPISKSSTCLKGSTMILPYKQTYLTSIYASDRFIVL